MVIQLLVADGTWIVVEVSVGGQGIAGDIWLSKDGEQWEVASAGWLDEVDGGCVKYWASSMASTYWEGGVILGRECVKFWKVLLMDGRDVTVTGAGGQESGSRPCWMRSGGRGDSYGKRQVLDGVTSGRQSAEFRSASLMDDECVWRWRSALWDEAVLDDIWWWLQVDGGHVEVSYCIADLLWRWLMDEDDKYCMAFPLVFLWAAVKQVLAGLQTAGCGEASSGGWETKAWGVMDGQSWGSMYTCQPLLVSLDHGRFCPRNTGYPFR